MLLSSNFYYILIDLSTYAFKTILNIFLPIHDMAILAPLFILHTPGLVILFATVKANK